MSTISVIFWGVLVLSVLVFVHEGGHFLAARAFGARVTEFFLGMPSRAKISTRSHKFGTEFGVTPLLLGGYTKICGMEGTEDELAPQVLAYVMQHGESEVEALAQHFHIELDRVYAIIALLCDWAALEPLYKEGLGEHPGQAGWPKTVRTVKRDEKLRTIYDTDHDFSHGTVYEAGTIQALPQTLSIQDFYAQERNSTYLGLNYPQRLACLFAGPLVNLLVALALVVITLSVVGLDIPVNSNQIGQIEPGSLAAQAGMVEGDTIISIDGTDTADFTQISEALHTVLPQARDFIVVVERDGATRELMVDVVDGQVPEVLGIYAKIEHLRLSPADAVLTAFDYAAQVGQFALKLITPSQTFEVLNNSSSVVGISVRARDAAAAGLASLLELIAAVSMSLGFMNLLPIPPLDGGKILIETVQLIIRRPLSQRAQIAISYIGLAFFLFVFVYVLRLDILRIMGS